MAEPVPVEGLYVELRILEKPLSFSRISIDSLRSRSSDWEDDSHLGLVRRVSRLPMSTTELVRQQQARLFVLGSPGAGKTTLLRSLALQSINGSFENIPIFVSLRELSDSGLALEAFIIKQFSICNFPDASGYIDAVLRKGNALLLLDGLDEVNEVGGHRRSIASEISSFVARYHLNRYIITARVGAGDESLGNFRFVEIATFNSEQIAVFSAKWFHSRTDLGNQFLNELHRHENLLELAQTPLLLTLLCLTFEEFKAFPRNRAELYKEAFEILLRKWDGTRHINRDEFYGNLSYERRRLLLMAVAYQTIEGGELFFNTETISRRIAAFLARLPELADTTVTIDDGEAVLKAIEAQHGVLSERAIGIYAFSHKTFLEFFAARHVVEGGTRDTLNKVVSRMFDRQWREVVLLTASLIGDADEMMQHMAAQTIASLGNRMNLLRLVGMVTEKAANTSSAHPRVGVWAFYLRLFLVRDIENTLETNEELQQAQDFFCSSIEDLARIGEFEGLLTLFGGRSFAVAGDDEIALDIALEQCISSKSKRGSYIAVPFEMHVERAKSFARKLEYNELISVIANCASLRSLDEDACIASFENIAAQHRQLEFGWSLSANDYRTLATFTQGLGLVLECLRLAPVSDRQKVLHRMLRAGDETSGTA